MRDSSERTMYVQNRRARFNGLEVFFAALVGLSGCEESQPLPQPPVDETMVVPAKKDNEISPVNQDEKIFPVPAEEISFEGLSANEKLDRIAAVIRSSWGDGKGFLFDPNSAGAVTSEDPLVLTLRWQAVEKKVAPLVKKAFGIEGTLNCRFSAPGEFECNNPIYQLAIQRAQNREKEYGMVHARTNATLVNNAPLLREQFLKHTDRGTEFYGEIRSSLMELALPGNLRFSSDEKDSVVEQRQCVLMTQWTTLPAEFEKSTESGLFQWRLKLVVREAVDKIESEWNNFSTEKNRLELVSFVQYRHGAEEPGEPVGPLGVTAIGFVPETVVRRYGKRFNSAEVAAETILSSPGEYVQVGAYPNPATFVGVSEPMRSIVNSVEQAVEKHLTVSE